jgi:nucleoside-diphosphate-sugar epimerase
MRILLTGATGFAGKAFLDLASSHYDIVCLGRTRPELQLPNITFVETDIQDRASVNSAADAIEGEFDALVHLAAYVPKEGDADRLQDAAGVNVHGTVNLLEAFNGRFKKHVLGSTVEVYDQTQIDSLITSKTPVGPVSYYASTKLASEFIALSFSKKNSIPTLILRFSVMYGPDDPIARAIPNFIKSALKNDPIAIRGSQLQRDYIHVTDVADSIVKAIDSSAEGVIAIGTGESITIEQTARSIVEQSNSKSTISAEEGPGAHIVIDPTEAEEKIGFKATKHFPDALDQVIASYRDA